MTGKAVDKKVVYNILRERCFDDPENPEDAQTHDVRNSKDTLTRPEAFQIQGRHVLKASKIKPRENPGSSNAF